MSDKMEVTAPDADYTHADFLRMVAERAYRIGYYRGVVTALHQNRLAVTEEWRDQLWLQVDNFLHVEWVLNTDPGDGRPLIAELQAKFPEDGKGLPVIGFTMLLYETAAAARMFSEQP